MSKVSSASSVRSFSTLKAREDDRSTIRDSPPRRFEDDILDDNEGNAEEVDFTHGDYASQRDRILADEDDVEEDGGEDEFVYTGVDASISSSSRGYAAQLADALEENSSVKDELTSEDGQDTDQISDQPREHIVEPSEVGTLADSPGRPSSPGPQLSADATMSASTLSQYYLHPSISRLRSSTPQQFPMSSSTTTLRSNLGDTASPSPSHFSAISRASSLSNIHSASEAQSPGYPDKRAPKPREAFRWTQLKTLSDYIFSNAPQKASTLLGSSRGSPTVIATSGLICVGTDLGIVHVFDFRQHFKFDCGSESGSKALGAVTALAMSNDHTFLAVGHATGHINLYDLARPQTLARSVPPTTLSAVASGRKEGHLVGSPVTQLGFIGLRHTAIVSADETGLAFYHSLGKVLFVEAVDVLRILGKYPEDAVTPAKEAPLRSKTSVNLSSSPATPTMHTFNGTTNGVPFIFPRQKRPSNTILSMAPLPLGTAVDPTDAYDLVALLTPVKLVIVGLRPTPRTWYRQHRGGETSEEGSSENTSRWSGCLAWFPSILLGNDDGSARRNKPQDTSRKRQADDRQKTSSSQASSSPILAYSWGRSIRLLKAREEIIQRMVEDTKAGNGKKKVANVGQVAFDDVAFWSADENVMAMQWLNLNQLLVLTLHHLDVYDVRSTILVERTSMEARSLTCSPLGSYQDAANLRVAHSIRVYKGKVFLLGRRDARVGTLLSWADRILSFVEEGDFLSAIDLARAYYDGTAPGNKNGLPDDPATLHEVVGKKLRDLMVASASYAFSEDRMTDGTHYSPDGRGVDLTPLFEGLVSSSVLASLSLNDFEFLYEDLYERYQSSGIAPIFLRQLEPFILDGSLRVVPTYITQMLISMHGDKGDYDGAERIIWHTDPMNLDSNQAIKLCQQYELYDALIYVCNRTLQDFVSPVVELLGLVRRLRRSALEGTMRNQEDTDTLGSPHTMIERLLPKAFKLYPYLGNVLSGLTYPSGEPLPPDLGFQAKRDMYQFLFSGHSIFWPPGAGGSLVLTADGGNEPTYPYLRLLLWFNSEAFLNALDLAFEDSYLNDMPQGVSRQTIVNILLKITAPDDPSSRDLSTADTTFVRIFVARNVPKYPQFIEVPPTVQQEILVGLADDPNPSTTEDRQLAAEFLLSAYTPHGRDELVKRFEAAGFYRILRNWYRHDRDWPSLLAMFLRDENVPHDELFSSIEDVLQTAIRFGKGVLPPEVHSTAIDGLPQLMAIDTVAAARLVDRYLPDSHATSLRLIGSEDNLQLRYLMSLLPNLEGDEPHARPSNNLDGPTKTQLLALLFRLQPDKVVPLITALPSDFFDASDVIHEADAAEAYDTVAWMLYREGRTTDAFEKIDTSGKVIAEQITQALLSDHGIDVDSCHQMLLRQKTLLALGLKLCQVHSQKNDPNTTAEGVYFKLLQTQIQVVQHISTAIPEGGADLGGEAASFRTECLDALRGLLQETFTQFVSQSSSQELSFPRLFKRLVDSTSASQPSSKNLYTEFRLILTGMLDSYRFEGDFLTLNNRLVAQDLFQTVAEGVKARSRGWRPKFSTCAGCANVLAMPASTESSATNDESNDPKSFTLYRSGLLYHSNCLPNIQSVTS
ncbi:Vacuolar protein sorting-associated protein 8 [Tulasnella sp. 403]|nr:Vacuolar protein sorting-associated protein 8 [Tulasnella sp. 403]